jgi:hypothetical protein
VAAVDDVQRQQGLNLHFAGSGRCAEWAGLVGLVFLSQSVRPACHSGRR